MAAFLGIFAFGMIGWWIVSLAFVIWLFVAVEKTHLVGSTICIILYVLFLQFLGKSPIFENFVGHPWNIILYVLGYLVLGFIWSFVKWWLFVNKVAQKRVERRERFVRTYASDNPPSSRIPAHMRRQPAFDEMEERWQSTIRLEDLGRPKVSANKGKITTWVMCWPVSFIVSLLDDFVRKVIKQLVLKFQKLYDAITAGAFKNVEKAEKAQPATPTRDSGCVIDEQ
jgi:hypothetical protein